MRCGSSGTDDAAFLPFWRLRQHCVANGKPRKTWNWQLLYFSLYFYLSSDVFFSAGLIHITEDTHNFLTSIIGGYVTELRGEILVKVKAKASWCNEHNLPYIAERVFNRGKMLKQLFSGQRCSKYLLVDGQKRSTKSNQRPRRRRQTDGRPCRIKATSRTILKTTFRFGR